MVVFIDLLIFRPWLLRQWLPLVLLVTSEIAISERRVNTNEGNAVQTTRVKIPPNLQIPPEWKPLIDPTVDEFWNEGTYKPDAGFVIWAKNPSIENAKLYLIRMNAKRDRLHTMIKQQEAANKDLIQQGIIANDYDFLSEAIPSKQKSSLDHSKETQIFFIFNPTCPHCKRQAQILSGSKNTTPMQIGGGELVNFPNLPPTVWATSEDIELYAKDKVTPVLVIYSRKTNNVASVKGVHSIDEIDQIITKLRKEDTKNGK